VGEAFRAAFRAAVSAAVGAAFEIRRAPMPQGTIRNFDTAARTGSLLDDQLDEFRFGARAVQASGLRELRIGQRVRFTLDSDHQVATLNIVSL
jgi:2-phospho-L-lactate guanylyltransferase